MAQKLPNIPIQAGVATSMQGLPLYCKGYLIGNESGLSCAVEMQGLFNPKNLYPGTVDFFPVDPGFSGNILISNVSSLTNVASWPSSFLSVDMVLLSDKIDTSLYPMSLPTRQTTTPTTSGNPIFSATVGYGSTVSGDQNLNIYNPANSGVQYEFHSARVFTNDTTIPTCNLVFNSGPDNNFVNPVSIVPHFCSSSPPTSTAHATSVDHGGLATGTTIEVIDVQNGSTLDFLLFPDKIVLEPGNNLTMDLSTGTLGHVVRQTFKWTEVPLNGTPASGGGNVPVITTAQTLVNTGNPAGTGIIAAQPAGDATNAVYMDNEGNFVLGDGTYNGDLQIKSAALGGTIFHVRAIDNTIFMDGVQPFPGDGFTFHSEDGSNQIHVTDSGATFANAAILSGGGNTNTIRDNVAGNVAMDLSAGTGNVSFPHGLSFPVGSISRIHTFTASVTTTPTAFAHGLGTTPTGLFYIISGTGTTAGSIQYSALGATNVTLTGSGSFTALITVYAL